MKDKKPLPFHTTDDLPDDDFGPYIISLFHRIILHYAFWFTEIRHQMGLEQSMEMLDTAFEKSFAVQMKRLSKTLGFEMKGNIPAALADLPRARGEELATAVSANWLANDGIWFQAVEFSHGMNEAKRCNDSAWAKFSPVEAGIIKKMLGLGEHPGLEGLKQALGFRLYARINTQSMEDDGQNAFIFRMNQCRVQGARKRKGLDDYPCKSGGMVEYTYFARAIDDRIKCECIACPPDKHPEEWYCAWRFSIKRKPKCLKR